MLAELTQEELAAGLDRVAMDVLSEAGVDAPPIDAFAVAKELGIAIALDDAQTGRARYVRLNGRWAQRPQPTILLRPEPRSERRHWAVAHEIGEHLGCRVFKALGVDPCETPAYAREQAANQMASRILLPTAWFLSDGAACGWDLFLLKSRYTTASHELIARRMLECPPGIIISVFDHGGLSWRRSNLPGQAPPLLPEEMACWRRSHDRRHPTQANAGSLIARAWPIHEDGWQREILRTEIGDVWQEC
jgi:Zn-dependent peptidase ImmA (M78 family)